MPLKRIVEYENWIDTRQNNDDVLICVTRSTYVLLRAIIAEFGFYQSIYYHLYSNNPQRINSNEFNLIDLDISKFLAGDYMCLSDLTELLTAQTDAILAMSAAGGKCGTDVGRSVYSGPVIGPGEYPSDFASLVEYQDYKCKMAHLIVSDLIYEIVTLGALEAGLSVADKSALALSLIAVLATPVPYDDILVVCALVGTVVAVEFVASDISGGYDDFVCCLYNAGNVTNGRQDFLALLETVTAVPFASAVVEPLLSDASLSRLFVRSSDNLSRFDGETCSCALPYLEVWVNDYDRTVVYPVVGQSIDLSLYQSGGYAYAVISAKDGDGNCKEFKVSMIDNESDYGGSSLKLCNGNYIYTNALSTVPDGTYCCQVGNIYPGGTTGTMTVRFDDW